MCKKNSNCKYPHKLTDKPSKCSPEQIRECHGDAKEHECEHDDE
ncbi:hypothetical protein [Natranaerobius thermophilus]|uniref:Uncharacterized protein n=1 Tax=Natranaerobius thermophilus (strain ATCC BAA-1301 / DSM 18059 / JW/NM-WN-LF) TaxID=457570 RepID=B2A0K9_NATTJ|nr:hypothetical protein [Natranaerobius thermophilus]ACB84570.1 conserved hypothetical protein [Natranaerobius thermophilus JW/NM-WN-LF]